MIKVSDNAVFCGLGAIGLIMVATIINRAEKVLAGPNLDVMRALPTKAELPGFANYQVIADPRGGKGVWATKRTDDAKLRITVLVAPTEPQARNLAQNIVYDTANGGMLQRTPSGRKIGQELWASKYSDGGPPRGSFTLISRDGCSVTIVQLMLKIDKGQRGEAMRRVISAADLKLAEDHAIKALDKLTVMGYTSRSAALRSHKKR